MNPYINKKTGALVQLQAEGDDHYYGLFGIKSYARFDREDRANIDAQLLQQYPDTSDCGLLSSYIQQLQNEIDKDTKNMTGNCNSGCRRVNQRHIDELVKRQTALKNLLSQNNCQQRQQQQQNQQFLNQTQSLLNQTQPTPISGTGSALGTIGSDIKAGLGSILGTGAGKINPATGLPYPAAAPAKKPNYLLYAGIGVAVIVGIVILKKVL